MRLYGALLALSFIWGLSFVFMKWLLEPAGVWGIVFLRCLAGALILVPIALRRRKKSSGPLPWKALTLVGIFNTCVPWSLISLSETVISTGMASIVNATTPIFAGILGFAMFRSRLSFRQWLGIAVGFSGILILTNFQMGHLLGQNFTGVGTMILASASYGLAAQLVKRYLSGVDVYVITFYSLVIGAGLGLAGTLATGSLQPDLLLHPQPIAAVIGLGCLGSGIGYVIYYYLMNAKGPVFATSVTYLVPVSAIVWGVVLLDETIAASQLTGIAVIFAGVYLSTWTRLTK